MKKTNRIFALLLAAAISVSFTACKKSGDVNSASESVEIVKQYVDENGNIINADENGNKTNTGSGNKDSKNESKSNSGGSGKGTSANNVDASKYRGTTITYATWKDPAVNEDGVAVESFKKKYGINVKIDMVNENDYVNVLVGRIAAGKSPDVIFCNDTFPAILQVLQPIDAAQLNLSDSIWDQEFIKQATVNGHKYLVNTVGNIWNEYDCLFYNKSILKKAGCYTPEEYDKQGKWTWDALEQIMKQVDALGGRYVGGALSAEVLQASVGAQPIVYSGGKFSNNVTQHTTDVIKRMSEWFDKGLAAKGNYEFIQGNAGVCATNAFGMKKTGYFANANHTEIAAYYLPDYNGSIKRRSSGIFRGWGLSKGAKNPVAAGIFMRWYLDIDNYESDKAFINKDAQRFFFELTTGNSENKSYYFFSEQNDAVSGYDAYKKFSTLGIVANKPEQVAALIEAEKNAINNGVKNLNSFISKF